MNDDEIIEQRIRGSSVRAIAKKLNCTVAQVSEATDHWAVTALDIGPTRPSRIGATTIFWACFWV